MLAQIARAVGEPCGDRVAKCSHAHLCSDFPADYPSRAQWTIEIQPLQETLVGSVRPMLLVLLGAVILIVFIVSLNFANLLLARASGRQQEMAVRLALGASRGRTVRQMLTESMLLSLIGGAAGVATAVGTLGFILRFVPSNIPRLNEVRIDWVVLAFALLISILPASCLDWLQRFMRQKSLSLRPCVKAVAGPATARRPADCGTF